MWRKIDDIAARCARRVHSLTDTGENSVTRRLRAQCIACAARTASCGRAGLSCKRRSQGVKKTPRRKSILRQQTCHSRHYKNETSFTTSEVQGDASWLD